MTQQSVESSGHLRRVDFDHYGPAMREGAPEVLADLRNKCPVAWTDCHDGFWVVTDYDSCYAVARDPVHFSSSAGVIPDLLGGFKLPPVSYDPPEHEIYRDLLQSWFTLKRMKEFEGFMRQCAKTRVEALTSPADLVAEYSKPFPRDVILGIIGVPDADMDTIGDMIIYGMEHVVDDPEGTKVTTERLRVYFAETLIASRRREPADDLVSHLVVSEIDGEPLSDELIAAFIHQVIGAGIDTTNKTLATALAHLAGDVDTQRELRNADLSVAVEEILRTCAPVSMGRLCLNDTEVGGQTIMAGERVLIMPGSANRDEKQFDDPDHMDFERSPNRHLTFGIGIHRCLGMHLARMELTIAFEELFNVVGEFRLIPGQPPTFIAGQVWGAVAVPVELRFVNR